MGSTRTLTICTTSGKTEGDRVLCSICDGPSASMRYGAVCCPGCAAFFARTMRKPDAEPYRCPMPVPCSSAFYIKRRCKACRFRRCRDERMRLPLKYSDSDGEASSVDSDLLGSECPQPLKRNTAFGRDSKASTSASRHPNPNRHPGLRKDLPYEALPDAESSNLGDKASVPSERLTSNTAELDDRFMERADKILTENSGFLDSLLDTGSVPSIDGDI